MNEEIITKLNKLMADEFRVSNIYTLYSSLFNSLGYTKLATTMQEESVEELGHVSKIASRILFLGGAPIYNMQQNDRLLSSITEIMSFFSKLEENTIQNCREMMQLADKFNDKGTSLMIEDIYKEEEEHVKWLKIQTNLIKEIGISQYLIMNS